MIGHKHVLMVSTVLTQQVVSIDCKTKKQPPNPKALGWGWFFYPFVEGQPPC